MKKLLLLFIAVSPIKVQAQNTETSTIPSRESKWKLGLCFSPDYAYRTLTASGGDPTASRFAELRDEREVAKLGYTAGLDARYQINKRFALSLGLQYSNKGYQTKTQEYGLDPFSTPQPNDIVSARVVSGFHYIDLPLMLHIMAWSKGNFSLAAGLGLTASVFLTSSGKSYLKYADGSKSTSRSTDRSVFKDIMLAPTVSLGLDYKLSQKSMLRMAPTYRYGVTTIVDAPINGFLWSYGLNLGYYRSL
jgi:hypothetical protein